MNAGPAAKRDRQRAIREIIVRDPIGNQQELAERLVERGFAVTQATVSRDIAELGHRRRSPAATATSTSRRRTSPHPRGPRPTSASGGSSRTSRSRSGGAG